MGTTILRIIILQLCDDVCLYHYVRLAHFLEHMLFMGTEKYPIENAYSSFLSSHGGMSNAYTGKYNCSIYICHYYCTN